MKGIGLHFGKVKKGGGNPIYSARGQFSGYPWKVVAERAMTGTWGESGNVLCLHMSVHCLGVFSL